MARVKDHFEEVINRRAAMDHVGKKIMTHQLSTTGEWCAWFEFEDLGEAVFAPTEDEAIDGLLERTLA